MRILGTLHCPTNNPGNVHRYEIVFPHTFVTSCPSNTPHTAAPLSSTVNIFGYWWSIDELQYFTNLNHFVTMSTKESQNLARNYPITSWKQDSHYNHSFPKKYCGILVQIPLTWLCMLWSPYRILNIRQGQIFLIYTNTSQTITWLFSKKNPHVYLICMHW